MADTSVQPQDPALPAPHAPAPPTTFDGSTVAPLAERCAHPTSAEDITLLAEWVALYEDHVAVNWDSYHETYAKYFLRLLNTLRSEAVVAQLTVQYHEKNRAHGMFRRSYDTLNYDQVRQLLATVIGDLPTRTLPLPNELAKAYPAFKYILQTFQFNTLLPTVPAGQRWFRQDYNQALNWLRQYYDHHLEMNFVA